MDRRHGRKLDAVIAWKGKESFVFDSALECSRFFGISRSWIYQLIFSGKPTSNGITFDFLLD